MIMDYKYINQLLERYWRCETSLEEEDILRAFFCQENIPEELAHCKAFFAYGERQQQEDVLGQDFDDKIMSVIDADKPVKARTITMSQRLRPLFKAAAIVAMILTLGNAMQLPFGNDASDTMSSYDGYTMPELKQENSMAMGDSAVVDTMKQTMVEPQNMTKGSVIK